LVCGTNVGLIFDLPLCCVSVNVGDFAELAHQVLRLLDAPSRINEMRKNAHTWTSAHSIHWTVNMISELYSSDPTT
jgi:hypothetical protein